MPRQGGQGHSEEAGGGQRANPAEEDIGFLQRYGANGHARDWDKQCNHKRVISGFLK